MAKFCGSIGFATSKEGAPGVWVDLIVDRHYYGDLIRNVRKVQSSGNVNDNITISNELSIVADPFANANLQDIRYVEFMGKKWKVVNVEISYPRLILTLGDVYNGKQA